MNETVTNANGTSNKAVQVGKLVILTTLFSSLLVISCGGGAKKQKTLEMESTNGVVNYLGSVTAIDFDGQRYRLAWSSPPQLQGNYYIQEYLPDGQIIEQYEDLLILDLRKDRPIDVSLSAKINSIEKYKQTDPTVSYQLVQSENGEYVVYLVLSDAVGDFVEWNIIRYREYENKGAPNGVRTFTLSKRGYGKNKEAFYKNINFEQPMVTQFLALPFPDITPQPADQGLDAAVSKNGNTDTDDIFIAANVDKRALFEGSSDGSEFGKYVDKNIIYPQTEEEGRVGVDFVIEKDGSVSNVTVIRGMNPLLDAEALRVIKSSPKWTPAQKDGEAVRMHATHIVRFRK